PAIGRRMESTSSSTSSTSSPSSNSETSPANVRISPKARRLAREHNINLSRVRGTGSDGEILAEDVLALVNPAAAVPQSEVATPDAGAGATETLTSIARLMGERTTQSWTSVPHFFLVRDVDASGLLATRENFAAAGTPRITQTDLLVALVARTLAKHPRVNA